MEQTLKQYEVLERASLFLKKHNREEGVAPLLLQHFLHVSRERFYMQMRDVVPASVARDFWAAIEEHAATGIPVERITGKAPFYGRDFYVNHDVLIPRPETEELVENVLDVVHKNGWGRSLSIVDIGTGSGIIAITLALELANARIYATDISEDALVIARRNASELAAAVTFLEGDLLQPIEGNAVHPDILVFNPPYIAEEDRTDLADTVRDFDPGQALFAADQGLAVYQRLFRDLGKWQSLPKLVALEIGDMQGEAVGQLATDAFPSSPVCVKKDINRKDRMVFVEPDG